MSIPGYSFADLDNLLHDRAVPACEKIEFFHKRSGDFELISLYCSMLELVDACMALIDRNIGYHSYPILRQLIENVVDIRLVLADAKYVKQLTFENLTSNSLTFKLAREGNPYLSKIASMPDFESVAAETKCTLERLKKEGFKKMAAEEKFRRVGMLEDYNGLYRQWSNHTHSNFGALVSRHVALDNGDPSFHAFNHGMPSDFLPVTTACYEYLLEVSVELHSRFGTVYADRGFWSMAGDPAP